MMLCRNEILYFDWSTQCVCTNPPIGTRFSFTEVQLIAIIDNICHVCRVVWRLDYLSLEFYCYLLIFYINPLLRNVLELRLSIS